MDFFDRFRKLIKTKYKWLIGVSVVSCIVGSCFDLSKEKYWNETVESAFETIRGNSVGIFGLLVTVAGIMGAFIIYLLTKSDEEWGAISNREVYDIAYGWKCIFSFLIYCDVVLLMGSLAATFFGFPVMLFMILINMYFFLALFITMLVLCSGKDRTEHLVLDDIEERLFRFRDGEEAGLNGEERKAEDYGVLVRELYQLINLYSPSDIDAVHRLAADVTDIFFVKCTLLPTDIFRCVYLTFSMAYRGCWGDRMRQLRVKYIAETFVERLLKLDIAEADGGEREFQALSFVLGAFLPYCQYREESHLRTLSWYRRKNDGGAGQFGSNHVMLPAVNYIMCFYIIYLANHPSDYPDVQSSKLVGEPVLDGDSISEREENISSLIKRETLGAYLCFYYKEWRELDLVRDREDSESVVENYLNSVYAD